MHSSFVLLDLSGSGEYSDIHSVRQSAQLLTRKKSLASRSGGVVTSVSPLVTLCHQTAIFPLHYLHLTIRPEGISTEIDEQGGMGGAGLASENSHSLPSSN